MDSQERFPAIAKGMQIQAPLLLAALPSDAKAAYLS